MPSSSQGDVTRLLAAIGEGERGAADDLLPLVYRELRSLAHARMAKEPAQTLQPTALVHEAYLRLVGSDEKRWENRGYFFAAAAEAMRRILIRPQAPTEQRSRGGEPDCALPGRRRG